MALLNELKRRNVLRVALAYGAGAWVFVGGMDILTGLFESPAWVMKVFVGAALLGLVPVLVFSWVYEVTPQGIQKEADLAADAPRNNRRLNIAILAALLLAIGLVVYESFDRKDNVVDTPDGPPMLAVLPFVSTSLDGESEFFAAGVHEDLLTQLAQLESIRVISRTSVSEYHGVDRNLREIGAALGADAILEGRVQSAGGKIRINAQLIDASNDAHLWAQTFDRELTPSNLFEVQGEIARAISTALNSTLSEQDTKQLELIPTTNMAAYRAYHRALEIRSASSSFLTPEYRAALEEAVRLDPGFMQPWAELVGFLSFEYFNDPGNERSMQEAEQILEKMAALAPESAHYLKAQAYYTYYVLNDFELAFRFINQAVARSPSDVRLLELKGWIQRRLGDFEGRVETAAQAHSLDPRNPAWTWYLARSLVIVHRYDEALAVLNETNHQELPLEELRAHLDLREHRNLLQWAADIEALQRDFPDAAQMHPELFWSTRIAVGDYSGAAQVAAADLEAIGSIGELVSDHDRTNWIYSKVMELVSQWLEEADENIAAEASRVLELAEPYRPENDRSARQVMDLYLASLELMVGNVPEAEVLVRRWQRYAERMSTEKAFLWHRSCRILGAAGLAAEAVDCIREGLEQPTLLMPFLEPYLPYYDAIRNEPEFIAMLQERGLADRLEPR